MDKFYIKTFGCQMNFSDSERVHTLLEKNNLKETKKIDQANLVIFNTCGVRQTAEDRLFGQVHNLRKSNPNCFIAVTGCLSKRKDVQRKLKDKADLFLPIKEIDKVINQFKNHTGRQMSGPYHPVDSYLGIIPDYKKKDEILVPIMTGCNNFCSYCVVPYARGPEKSRPANEIVAEIKNAKQVKKITLLGQNVNSYKSKKTTFPQLLNNLAETFPNIEFDFLTSHPKDFSDELINVIENNKNISQSIHLPIQSGSNKILKDMNRKYTAAHYLKIITKIKKALPKAQISTDVIVGFPTETEKEFQETVELFKKIKFSEAYVNKYSPRPGTAAEKLGDPISWEEKKRREKILREIISS